VVRVTVLVRDKKGADVPDLAASDFEIIDEKTRVDIAAFAHVGDSLPREDKTATAYAPAATPPAAPAQLTAARVLLLIFDDLQTPPQYATVAAKIAQRMLERTAPGDMVAVRRAGDTEPTIKLTPNADAGLDEIRGWTGQSSREFVADDATRQQQTMATLAGVAQVADLAHDRRVAVVLLSAGIDTDLLSWKPNANDVRLSMESAVASLRRANVVLYTTDPRGLVSKEGDVVESGGVSGNDVAVAGPLGATALRASRARLSLRHLAEETSGFAAIDSNDFTSAIERIDRETRHYYVLGFVPADDRCSGGVRRVRVKVHRPGVRVVARSLYACIPSRRP
jgi:VWFA-related protein